MNNYIKQAIYIILISIIFSLIRYFFIKDEYSIVKKVNNLSSITSSDYSSIAELEKYINDINEPTLIDFDLAKRIYENNLSIFIDARDYDSFQESHIYGAVNIPYDNIELIEQEYDLKWMYDQREDFSFSIQGFDYDFIIGLQSNIPFIRDLEHENDLSNREMSFVIYCSGEGCSLSEDLSYYLFENFNFKKIMIFEGGMPVWKEKEMRVQWENYMIING